MLSRLKIMINLCENPGIALGSPSHHKTVTACLSSHCNGILRRKYITVSDNRDFYGFLNLFNNIPVSLAGMQLEFKGPFLGIREMRKHAAWYTGGYKHAAKLRTKINEVETYEELEELLYTFLAYNDNI